MSRRRQQQQPTTTTPATALIGATMVALLVLAAALTSPASALVKQQAQASSKSVAPKITISEQPTLVSQRQDSIKQDIEHPATMIADKKQGDSLSAASAASASSSASIEEEYVQVKPEEVSGGAQAKEAGGEAMLAEHKSAEADLELNAAQLAQDTINQQESMQQSAYAAPRTEPRDGYRPAGPPAGHYGPSAGRQAPMRGPRPSHHHARPAGYPAMMPVRAPMLPMHRPAPVSSSSAALSMGHRLPPSYVTLKGKLTGINSLISQYPHPAPGYPHHGPRHLPRGAAAGYAAFRDFVRAHASKYKHVGSPVQYPVQSGPGPSSYGPPAIPAPLGDSYNAQGAAKEAAYGGVAAPSVGHPKAPKSYGSGGGKTRVTVAQAYIPHLTASSGKYPQQQQSGYGAELQQALGPYGGASGMGKFYGGHAPQGHAKPEYNKDFGMVIHYPQATVYTEPMTVDQLHKLAGNGISQVIEQLQYNLASGHRDETNTLRSNNKHHLGHGVTIHAKEYYAPGKGGHYVPTTAAVIQTQAQKGYGQHEAASAGGYSAGGYSAPQEYATQAQSAAYPSSASDYTNAPQDGAAGPYGGKPELGSGYERVKQAAAAAAAGHESKYQAAPEANTNKYQQASAKPDAYSSAQQQVAGAYEQSQQQQQQQQQHYNAGKQQEAGASYQPSNGEPLSAVTNFIGSELESLYKANAELNKHLEQPEVQEQIRAYAKSSASKGPLKYHDLHTVNVPHQQPAQRYPQQQQHQQQQQQQQQQHGRYQQSAPHAYGGQQHPRGPRGHPRGRGTRYQPRPHGPRPHQQQGYRMNPQQQYNRQPQPHQPQQQQQQHYDQQASIQSADLSHQMMQLLQDFRTGDEQYNTKPPTKINQGYPHKAMQKPGNQQAYGQSAAAASAYNLHDGIEFPQGPNDQIGEIHELIEALKGSLEGSHKQPEAPANGYEAATNAGHQKQADVNYLTSALGQAPSYSLQVPVANGDQYQQQQQQQQQHQAPQAPAQAAYGTKGAPVAPEAAAGAYQQQQPQQATTGYHQQAQQPAGYQQPQQSAGYQQAQQSAGYQQAQQSAGYGQHQAEETGAGYGQAVANAIAASAAGYEQAKQPEAYQPQQQSAYQQAAAPAAAGYGAPAAPVAAAPAAGYEAQAQQQYGQLQQQVSSAGYGAQQQAAQAQPQEHYAQGQQQAAQADYHQQQAPRQADYAGQQQVSSNSAYSSPPAHNVISGTYPQQQQQQQHHHQQASAAHEPQQQQYGQQQQQVAPVAQQAPASYSSSEHSQVINHLVPIVQAQAVAVAAPVAGYEQSAGHNQQQLAIAAPVDAGQYQQAQSLSSFVDSLAAEYQQELLRHPAAADGQSSGYSNQQQQHEAQQQLSGYSGSAPSASAAAAANAAYDALTSQQHQHEHQQQHHQQQQHQQQELYSMAASNQRPTYQRQSAKSQSSPASSQTSAAASPSAASSPSSSSSSSSSAGAASSSSSASAAAASAAASSSASSSSSKSA